MAVGFKEFCEELARRSGVAEDRVALLGQAFWNASPTGELTHVFEAMARAMAEGWLRQNESGDWEIVR